MKLSFEEKEALISFADSSALQPLLKLLDQLVEAAQVDVVKLNLDGSTDRDLLIRKARAEGAARLATSLRTRLSTLRAKQDA